jgi:RhtB (resistance to homoserine/threonine) family protein
MAETLIVPYLLELMTVFSITLLTVVTPGPDFIVVVRNSLVYSRRAGIFTSLGVAAAVWVHIAYTLAGIGVIMSKSILLFSVVKYLGAIYLVYLGIGCVRGAKSNHEEEHARSSQPIGDFAAFKMGFINNALNPKATLFFLSLFTQVVSSQTPIFIQILYGALVSLSCVIWFCMVAIFLNQKGIRGGFQSVQFYLEKVMGVVLIGLGVKVAFSTAK